MHHDLDPIDPAIRAEILRRLAAAEVEHGVRILYAVESGSRAWGFASPDSDYDVRFLYVRPADWYLSYDIEFRRDVIEYPIVDDIDCSGWDIRKALYLYTRSNGALLEWLFGPIRYREHGDFAAGLRVLAREAMNPLALCYHYSHMARRNAGEYLDGAQVRLKKYFYVLRPLFAIRYLQAGLGPPPVRFEALVEAVAPPALRPDIADLLERKRHTAELGHGDPIPAINAFIASELERHQAQFTGVGRPDLLGGARLREALNALFRTAVRSTSRPDGAPA
ncbi:MAG: nucleotidyltransferase domain-containing protein [Xanthomonadales bacterium]|jgi:hypothetical protein|nr:nucleotidyltransferase domain-containing protein [Xanthomonadales bacterium]